MPINKGIESDDHLFLLESRYTHPSALRQE